MVPLKLSVSTGEDADKPCTTSVSLRCSYPYDRPHVWTMLLTLQWPFEQLVVRSTGRTAQHSRETHPPTAYRRRVMVVRSVNPTVMVPLARRRQSRAPPRQLRPLGQPELDRDLLQTRLQCGCSALNVRRVMETLTHNSILERQRKHYLHGDIHSVASGLWSPNPAAPPRSDFARRRTSV